MELMIIGFTGIVFTVFGIFGISYSTNAYTDWYETTSSYIKSENAYNKLQNLKGKMKVLLILAGLTAFSFGVVVCLTVIGLLSLP